MWARESGRSRELGDHLPWGGRSRARTRSRSPTGTSVRDKPFIGPGWSSVSVSGALPPRSPSRICVARLMAEISKLLVALELEEFGFTPAVIAKLFTARWDSVSHIVARAARKRHPDDQDILLWIYPQFLSARWRRQSELPEIGKLASRRAMEQFYFWLQPEKPGGVSESNPRACVFNLSSRWRPSRRRSLSH
jgi:hypothetical protein